MRRYELHPDAAHRVWDWWEYRLNEDQRQFVMTLLGTLEGGGLEAVKVQFYVMPEASNLRAVNAIAEGIVVQLRPLPPRPDQAGPVGQFDVSIDWYAPDEDFV